HAAHVIDVVMRDDGPVEGGDAERVEQPGDPRAAARRAAVDEERPARRRDDQRPGALTHIDKIDPGLPHASLCAGTLTEQKEDKRGDGRELFRHGNIGLYRDETVRRERESLDAGGSNGQPKSVWRRALQRRHTA